MLFLQYAVLPVDATKSTQWAFKFGSWGLSGTKVLHVLPIITTVVAIVIK